MPSPTTVQNEEDIGWGWSRALKAYRQPKRSKVARRPMTKLADEAFEVNLFEHREWPTKGHEQHQPGHGPQREATDNRVRVGVYIPASIIGLELVDDDGGHRSGPWPQRQWVSHIPRHQGEHDTTERRIQLLGSAENDAASGGQFLFLRSCRPRRVWISGEVQGRIALERLTLSYDGEPFDASAYPDISGRIHPPSPSTVHGGESVSLAEIFT
jgi:hypothetical protein